MGQSSHEVRFSLSQFPSRRTSSKPVGLQAVPRLFCGNAPFVNAIPSSVTDAAASKHTMSITTGLASVAVAAPVAEDLHIPAGAFSPLHALQPAGSLSGMAAACCGALLLGRGEAYAQRP